MVREHHLAGEEHAGDVEIHLAVPLGLGEVRGAAHPGVADIVVEDVDPAEERDGSGDDASTSGAGDVAGERLRRPPSPRDDADRLFRRRSG
jgi:hypothetical protein